jgi:hypothetical protein
MLSYGDITPAQEKALNRLFEGDCLFIAPKGFGKAAVAHTAAQELIEEGVVSRILVCCPLRVAQLTWAKEWQKWSHLEEPGMAIGGVNQRKLAIAKSAPITVTNFDNLPWLLENVPPGHFDGLIVDESTRLKAAGSGAVKALRKRLKDFKWRLVMSADPVAETGVDIYTQALITDGGAALGRNQELFRRKYFYPTDYEQRKWDILPGQEAALAAALSGILYVAEDDGYEASLPALEDIVVPVGLDIPTLELYLRMEETGEIAVDGVPIVAEGAAAVKGKLQQIASGQVYDADSVPHHIHSAKQDALQALLEDIDEPVMIAYAFDFEKPLLAELGCVFLADDPAGVEERWNRGEIPLLALHPRSAAHGLNLQYGGCRLIVLSLPWGADPWEQLVGRLRRRGQASDVVWRYSLCAMGTVDEEILDRQGIKGVRSKVLNAAFAAG